MAMPSSAPRTAKTLASQLRRVVVVVIIVCFGLAALGGIVVLLGGADSDPAYKVLATTALTGVFSVAVLCGATLIGKAWQWFGWATIGVSLVTLIRMLWLVWAEPIWSDESFKLSVTLCLITGAAAISSLLLLLVTHKSSAVRVSLFVTLALIALAVVLTLLPLWDFEPAQEEPYTRALGIVWILAALGVVVLPVVSLLLRNVSHSTGAAPAETTIAQATPTAASTVTPATPVISLSPGSVERIARAAQAAGVTPDELIDRLLPRE